MIFIIYLFTSLALAYAWSDTEVSRPFRNFIAKIPYIRKPLLCHECSSFWISLGLSLFINPIYTLTYPILSNVFSAFCGFLVNMFFVRNEVIKQNLH
jgi:hypothetical protein